MGLIDPAQLRAAATTESLGGPAGGFGGLGGPLWGAIPAPYRGLTGPYRTEPNVSPAGVSGDFSPKSPKHAHLDVESKTPSYARSRRSNGSRPPGRRRARAPRGRRAAPGGPGGARPPQP